jgi:hypothetical protein
LNFTHKSSIFLIKIKVKNSNNYNYLTARCNVAVKGGGKWFYEVKIQTNSQMLLGWCTDSYNQPPDSYKGLGCDPESWGFDGYNSYKVHAGTSNQFGSTYFTTGDVFGFGLDIDSRKIVILFFI